MDAELERAEIAAMRAQWSGLPGATVRDVGGLHVFAAAGPAWLTQICGFGLAPDHDLAAALAVAPEARLSVVDGTVDAAALRRRGYRPATPLLRLAGEPGGPEPRVRVEVVGPESAELVAAVAGEGFGLDLPQWWGAPLGAPGWTQVVLHVGGTAVATGGLHVAGPAGWLGAAATVPAARARGAQTALLTARRRLAAEQGARRLAAKVEPGTASHRNLLRAGFVETYGLTQWARG